ncbi:MAG: tRNA pseudouridine(38-40) synthase TruA [Deltaproteobacteria bacterium]|nr:tRNA pseudouridine(38-40) synthase TruA [Deltaproteobacteria bacterium]MCL5792379.1 tRNA pseudouridine(38-40) synthase TruA [Deltaproteobacteria bacterium]
MIQRNIKLTIEYDGTSYNGWQTQADVPSIQSAIKSAIEKVTGEHIKLIGAGRTDTGVHAKAQAANFITSSGISIERMPYAINAHLPSDIVIKSAQDVRLGFNARKDAKAREYRYVIYNGRYRTATNRLYSYHVAFKLDIHAMEQAANYLKGEHDFAGFVSRQKIVPTYKNIMKLDIEKKDDFIYVTIKADGFLHHMVRYIVSALIEAGRGSMRPEDVMHYIEPECKKWGLARAPAKGLFLMNVEY